MLCGIFLAVHAGFPEGGAGENRPDQKVHGGGCSGPGLLHNPALPPGGGHSNLAKDLSEQSK